jgi:hypothetical protein
MMKPLSTQKALSLAFSFETADDYHSQRDTYLSSHQLLDFIKCPYLHHKKRTGQIEETDSNAYLTGRAAHVRILEGRDIYEQQFAMGGPINPTTGRPYGSLTKKFAEWKDEQQKPVLTFEQVELVKQMAAAVALNDKAVELISCGIAEGVIRRDYCGIPCQIRLDWFNPNRGIVDLKTCDDLTWFEADARRYRYPNQMAFYQAVLKEAIGEYVPIYLVAVEKKEPFRCGVWRVSDDCLVMARQDNEAAIERLQSCRKKGIWPTGYEEVRVLDVA